MFPFFFLFLLCLFSPSSHTKLALASQKQQQPFILPLSISLSDPERRISHDINDPVMTFAQSPLSLSLCSVYILRSDFITVSPLSFLPSIVVTLFDVCLVLGEIVSLVTTTTAGAISSSLFGSLSPSDPERFPHGGLSLLSLSVSQRPYARLSLSLVVPHSSLVVSVPANEASAPLFAVGALLLLLLRNNNF